MSLPSFLNSIVTWLRAGYPEGVPDVDYLPLFALLASQLTDQQVAEIASELTTGADEASARAIREAITEITDKEEPSDADVARVRARLAGGGWPLAKPDHLFAPHLTEAGSPEHGSTGG
jgi:hypothetical protein